MTVCTYGVMGVKRTVRISGIQPANISYLETEKLKKPQYNFLCVCEWQMGKVWMKNTEWFICCWAKASIVIPQENGIALQFLWHFPNLAFTLKFNIPI